MKLLPWVQTHLSLTDNVTEDKITNMNESRRFSKERLSKLVFWFTHGISFLFLAFGGLWLLNAKNFEKMMLAGEDTCHSTGSIDYQLSCAQYYFGGIEDYNDRMVYSLFFGVTLLITYWVVRYLFNYLFPKTIDQIGT